MKLQKNKKGWLEIVEAFTSVLLIAGVLILLAGNFKSDTQNFPSQVYDLEHAILREIQFNNSLRNEVISVSQASLPITWDDFDSNLPNVMDKIELENPSYLECTATLCRISEICTSEFPPVDEEVFVQSVFVGANIDNYSPKKLSLFCWRK
ncbi:MAG: hypothetical protein AABX93_00780 [Nanoarchaeota archaeon]|mgnify:CR=1 FL=1